MNRMDHRSVRWLAALGVLALNGPGMAAPRAPRTPGRIAVPHPAAPVPAKDAAAAPTAPARCAPVVAESRAESVYVATGAGCALVPGTTMTSRDGAVLEVADTGTTWARLVLKEGPRPAVLGRLEIASTPARSSTAPAPAPSQAGPGDEERVPGNRGLSPFTDGNRGLSPLAGPGVASRIAPPGLFQDAARARVPRPSSPGGATPGARSPSGSLQVHGRLGFGVTGVADLSDRSAGWWRPFVESTLDLDRPGDVAWTYRHRLRGQWRFDGRSASQPWDGDEPRLGLHELRAGASFLDRRLTVGLGRLAPDGVAGADTVDGGVLEGRVLDGLHVGAFGGLLPHPTSLLPDLRGTGFGAWVRGAGKAGMTRLSGSLLLSGTTWKGRLDETRADARLAVAAGRYVDVWALGRLDVWPVDRAGNRPVADLSRLLAGVRARPLARLDVGARFAWHHWTASRRSRDLWGSAYASPSRPAVGLAGLDLRWEPVDGLEIRVEGDADVTGPAATGWAAGGALAYTLQGRTPCRFEVRYRYQDGDVVRGHHAGAEAYLPFHPSVSLDAGYRLSRYDSVAAGPSVEHDARLGLLARIHRPLLLFVGAEWMQGDDVMALFASGRLDWRF